MRNAAWEWLGLCGTTLFCFTQRGEVGKEAKGGWFWCGHPEAQRGTSLLFIKKIHTIIPFEFRQITILI